MTLAPRICSALSTILVLAIVGSFQLAAQTPAAPPVSNQTPADARQLQQLEPFGLTANVVEGYPYPVAEGLK